MIESWMFTAKQILYGINKGMKVGVLKKRRLETRSYPVEVPRCKYNNYIIDSE